MINVGLDDVRIFDSARRGEGDFNGAAQIDRNDIARTPAGNPQGVPPFATTTFQNYFAAKKIRGYGRNPAQKLRGVFFIFMRESLPGPAELVGRGSLFFIDRAEVGKARNATNNRISALTLNAG